MQVGIEVSSTRSQLPELVFDSLQSLFPAPAEYSPSKIIRGDSVVVGFASCCDSIATVRVIVTASGDRVCEARQ